MLEDSQRLESVSNELRDVKLDKSLQCQFMRRVQLGETLREAIASNTVNGLPIDEATSTKLRTLLDRKAELTKDVLTVKKDIAGSQRDLDQLKSKNLEYLCSNRKLMQDIHTSQTHEASVWEQVNQNPAIVRQTEKLARLKACLSLYRNTLQGVILASGVDWAGEDDLLATMLDMGVPLCEKLRHALDS